MMTPQEAIKKMPVNGNSFEYVDWIRAVQDDALRAKVIQSRQPTLMDVLWRHHNGLTFGEIQTVIEAAHKAARDAALQIETTKALKECYTQLNRAMNTGLDPSVATDASIAACNARAVLGIPGKPEADEDRDSDSVPLDPVARGKA